MCCNCVPAAFDMQPNHFWPIFRCKIVSFSLLSIAKHGGVCASFISTTAFSAFNSKLTCSNCIITEPINCPNSWRERATTWISPAKPKCKFGPPSIKSMPPCPTAGLHFRMANFKTRQNNCGLRAALSHTAYDRELVILTEIAQTRLATMLANVPGQSPWTSPRWCSTPDNGLLLFCSTKYSLIKGALQIVVLHGNHVVLQVALHQIGVGVPIFQGGGMQMFSITNVNSQFVWNLWFILLSLVSVALKTKFSIMKQVVPSVKHVVVLS